MYNIYPDINGLYYCGRRQDHALNDYLMFSYPMGLSCHGRVSVYRNNWNSCREFHVTLQHNNIDQTQNAQASLGAACPPVIKTACHTFYRVSGDLREGYVYNTPFEVRDDCRKAQPLPAQNLADPAGCLLHFATAFVQYLNTTYCLLLPETGGSVINSEGDRERVKNGCLQNRQGVRSLVPAPVSTRREDPTCSQAKQSRHIRRSKGCLETSRRHCRGWSLPTILYWRGSMTRHNCCFQPKPLWP